MSREPVEPRLDLRFQECGRAVSNIGNAMKGYRALGVDVIGLSVRAPDMSVSGEFLLTVRGVDADGQRVVAFHSATTLEEVFQGLEARLLNGSLKWRADTWGR